MSTYAELAAALAAVPTDVVETRKRRRIPLRVAAHEVGVSLDTLWRVEHGDGVTVRTLVLVLYWLDDANPLGTARRQRQR